MSRHARCPWPAIRSADCTPYAPRFSCFPPGGCKGSPETTEITAKGVEYGLSLMIVGLAFKVIIADTVGILWHDIRTVGFESISTPLAWIGAAAYSVQLLFDFQGYSLMAVGLGSMLGFRLPRNFDHPYRSLSVSEYYRRWHMSLGRWFRDYLYIPLGGSRRSAARMVTTGRTPRLWR